MTETENTTNGFKSRNEARNWLNSQGFKVSKGKFSTDCKKGFPPVREDGTLDRLEVIKYANSLNLVRVTASPKAVEIAESKDELERQLLEIKLRRAKADERIAMKKEAYEWVEREWHAALFAGLITELKDSLAYHLDLMANKIRKEAVKGEPELVEAIEHFLAVSFNETVSKARIKAVQDAERTVVF